MDLSMVVEASSTMVLYNYDNSRVVAQCKKNKELLERKIHRQKVHLIREFMGRGKIMVSKTSASTQNLTYLFLKTLTRKVF